MITKTPNSRLRPAKTAEHTDRHIKTERRYNSNILHFHFNPDHDEIDNDFLPAA
jgi:hypothetical protein